MNIEKNNKDLVMDFIKAWEAQDHDLILEMLSDDVVYHNIPMPVLEGKAAAEGFIRGNGKMDKVQWDVLNIVAEKNVVLTERIDKFYRGDNALEIPVMGTFIIKDGKISIWRDYFDLNTFINDGAWMMAG